MSGAIDPRSASSNTTDAIFDLVLALALDPWLSSELEALGLTPGERWHGCQLGLNAATARLEPRCHEFAGTCEAEGAIELWTSRALAHGDRTLTRDFPEAHRLITEGLDPALGIAAVPVATILLRRADVLERLATTIARGRPRFASAHAALRYPWFTCDELRRLEERIDSVEDAARCTLVRPTAPSPEQLSAESWCAYWSATAQHVLDEHSPPSNRPHRSERLPRHLARAA